MLTVKDAAESLGISQSLVYALCSAKKIRHERYGLGRGTIRIPTEALDEYRAGRTVGVGQAAPAPRKVKLSHIKL